MNHIDNAKLNIQQGNNKILENIKSKYVIQNVFNYIKNSNFKYKLVNHNKYFQNLLDLTLFDYQEKYFRKYIENVKLDVLDYLTKNPSVNNQRLQEKLKENLTKYNYENNYDFQRYALFCIKNYLIKNEAPLFIDIYSPFFDSVSNSDFFENIFLNIYINDNNKYNLKNDYISFFNKLNKQDLKYPGISFYVDNIKETINYFEIFNINLKKIKRINLLIYNNKIFEFLFSNDFKNNLLYLELNNENKLEEIGETCLEKINQFQKLNELHLIGFIFKNVFILKLPNLKLLYISNCNNITLSKDSTLNLKSLYFELSNFVKQDFLFKFPELEQCNFGAEEIYGIVDLSSLKKLKTINSIFASDFIYLESKTLEKAIILKNSTSKQIYDEGKDIKKILSLKTLKKVTFEIDSFPKDILEISDRNYNITNLHINWVGKIDCILYDFQKLFPNLIELNLDFQSSKEKHDFGKIEIIETNNCKINKFSLYAGYHNNIQFYIGKFENLISVNLNICKVTFELDFKKIFPLFDNDCDIIFKNLKHFDFCGFDGYNSYDLMKREIINNIYNNLDKMPNLKTFSMKCIYKHMGDLSKKFFEKILSLNQLEEIELQIVDKKNENGIYSKSKLKKMFPSIDFSKYKKLKLYYNYYYN